LNDGREFPAELVACDPMNDVAILRIDAKEKFSFLKLGDSAKLKLGMEVLTFGNALGLFENSVSYGIISGLSRSITAKTDAWSSSMTTC
jgi:serine protease Do